MDLLKIENITKRYSGHTALDDVSLSIPKGSIYGLLGPNGAGKTTLVKLLLGLYIPTTGTIYINGIDTRILNKEKMLASFSGVFQDFALFEFPLDENVAAGYDVDEQRLNDVLEQMGLNSLIRSMHDKEKTILNQENGKGIRLSGGEKQKVAIARAFYKNASVIILDEPTAALDPVTEEEIYAKFDALVSDKLAIYVSHRMSSCKFCENIIVLDKGEIAEVGNHYKLMKKEGVYWKLYTTQAKYYNREMSE